MVADRTKTKRKTKTKKMGMEWSGIKIKVESNQSIIADNNYILYNTKGGSNLHTNYVKEIYLLFIYSLPN